jgi:hypothetical protein
MTAPASTPVFCPAPENLDSYLERIVSGPDAPNAEAMPRDRGRYTDYELQLERLTFGEAQGRFREAAKRDIPVRNEKRIRRLKPSEISDTVRHARESARQLMVLRKLPVPDNFDDALIGQIWVDLDRAPRFDGEENYNRRTSQCRLFRQLVLGEPVHGKHRRRLEVSLTDGFRPLWEVLEASEAARRQRGEGRRYFERSGLLRLQDLCLKHGYPDLRELEDGPMGYVKIRQWVVEEMSQEKAFQNLPEDPDEQTLRLWLRKVRKRLNLYLTSYRAAVRRLPPGSGYPLLLSGVDEDGSGPKAYERWIELVRKKREDLSLDQIRKLSNWEVTEILAPGIAASVDEYAGEVESGDILSKKRVKRGRFRETLRAAGSWLCGAILMEGDGLGLDLDTINVLYVFRTLVPAEVTRDAESSAGPKRDSTLDELLSDTKQTKPARTRKFTPVIRELIERMALRSYQRSPLRLTSAEARQGRVPMLTLRLRNVYWHLWFCVERKYLPEMRKHPDRHVRRIAVEVQAAHLNMRKFIKGVVQQTNTDPASHKNLALLAGISYADIVVVGLPHLRKRVLRADAVAKAAEPGSPAHRAAVAHFDTMLREYVIVATAFADGKRRAQYANGLAHYHLKLKIQRSKSGQWERILEMRTIWYGVDAWEPAQLKISHTNGKARVTGEGQGEVLPPGIIDYDLFLRYWLETRPRDLVTCGLLPHVADYDPDSEADTPLPAERRKRPPFAIFPTPKAQKGQRDKAEWRGRMTGATLSATFRRGFYAMLVEGLGVKLPALGSLQFQLLYRSLLNIHVIRFFIATYWIALRQNYGRAQTMSDDTFMVLLKHYTNAPPGLADRDDVKAWHPLIDRIFARREGDRFWGRFWEAIEGTELMWENRQHLIDGAMEARRRA